MNCISVDELRDSESPTSPTLYSDGKSQSRLKAGAVDVLQGLAFCKLSCLCVHHRAWVCKPYEVDSTHITLVHRYLVEKPVTSRALSFSACTKAARGCVWYQWHCALTSVAKSFNQPWHWWSGWWCPTQIAMKSLVFQADVLGLGCRWLSSLPFSVGGHRVSFLLFVLFWWLVGFCLLKN